MTELAASSDMAKANPIRLEAIRPLGPSVVRAYMP